MRSEAGDRRFISGLLIPVSGLFHYWIYIRRL
jgi:hypothetical protein